DHVRLLPQFALPAPDPGDLRRGRRAALALVLSFKPEVVHVMAVVEDRGAGEGPNHVDNGLRDVRPAEQHIVQIAAVLAQPAAQAAHMPVAIDDFYPRLLQRRRVVAVVPQIVRPELYRHAGP